MRLIDADALIEFIENRYDITWENDYEGGIKDACVDILEEICKMPTIEPRPRWIPVMERLPKEEIDVFVCNTNGDVAITSGAMSLGPKDSWIWHNISWKFGKVFAWMPLPVGPYREEG